MDDMIQFFEFKELPESQRQVAEPYYWQAVRLAELVGRSAERTVALRKLLESRDAALRAVKICYLGDNA